MERFSQRESVLLGYNLQRPLTNAMNSSSSKTSKPFRNSDVDFHDVFGGPPRRFSMQEVRPGFRVAADQDDDDDDDEHNEPWPVLGNKPVFGDDRASRRRLPSADFFNDIFGGGGASVHSTPKRHGRDYVFPASPGSRALSPLPPKAEPFGASSLLSQFSLPGKVSKAVEVPTFGSSSRSQHKHKDGSPNGIPHSLSSGTSLPRFSIEAVQTNEARSSPFSSEDPPKSDKADGDSKKNSESSKGNSATSNGLFHFSVYKWKTKGVPLDIPLRGKANSRSSKDFAKSEPLSGINEDDDNNNKARNIASQTSNKTTPLAVESCSNGRSLPNGHSSTLEHSNKLQNGFSHDEFTAEKEAPSAVKNEPDKAFVASKEEPKKPEVKSVHSLFYDDLEKGLDVSTNCSSSPVVGHTKTTKKQERKNTSSTGSAANKVNRVQFSPRRESNGRSKVKGRVKDFVKMFNQESSPKTQDGNMFRNKSCKWNEKCAFEDEEKLNTPKEAAEKFKMPKAKANDLKQSAKVHASGPDSSMPTSGSLSDGSKATAEEIHESFHDNFQVKEITQDENGQLGSVTQNQEFQGIDAKIRQWTKGKEGNIRSLLSTLQYVLWAESGWRPVPLVDIIEGNAVKRAYQKALLCLHPDKLQQKGAASHQKYLAEKVFDILQEAWNYFNSLGAV